MSHSSSQCLLVSTVFGMVSSLHSTSFLMIFILVSLIFYPGLALTVARGEMILPVRSTRYIHTRMRSVRAEDVTFTCNQDKMASV